ncbi:MAG: chloride channel protein [Chthoniobacterales bacterium]
MKNSRSSKGITRVWLPRYAAALALVGILSGLVGAFFTFVLYGVEHLVFGFTTGTLAEAITRVSPLHRFAAVAGAGVLVAVVWYLFRLRGPRIPSPSEIYAGKRISTRWMAADPPLQVVNVAAGGSIGREGAPRQLGAMSAVKASEFLGLDEDSCRLLVACGAGAGLAAIYNVPFGGTVFAIETIIGMHALRMGLRASLNILLSTLSVSWIATLVARLNVPDRPTYVTDWQNVDARLLLAALLIGPLAGAAGQVFAWMMDRAAAGAPRGATILWKMPLCYVLLAGLAIPLPLVLGNGHAMAQNVFGQNIPLVTAALLILAKPLATLLTVGAGATGGRLTPSLATGAALGFALAGLCSGICPLPATDVAILGATAFLAGAMRAPFTAGVLGMEFTGAGPALWGLAALAVAGAWLTSSGLSRLRPAKN